MAVVYRKHRCPICFTVFSGPANKGCPKCARNRAEARTPLKRLKKGQRRCPLCEQPVNVTDTFDALTGEHFGLGWQCCNWMELAS